ncbi:MAG: arylesterase [Betaproteobacteria bacterium RIFCSPLOWO2_02_FULL_65_20]|nr:MAG: arylesterase [Betaproteobacteria bacterium RIFCSPLOWO2_02_FULL_65_20]
MSMTLFHKLLLALALLGPGLAHAGATLLVYGDSLSAAYGIGQKQGWVTLLEERLRQKHFDYTVANASISGETSSGGASRIAATLAQHRPRIVILALGANDGLRGLPVAQMRDNLAAIVRAAQKAGSRVLLVGMKMPPNYGPQYTRELEQAYATLARRYKTAFVPFLLDGIAGKRDNFLDDNLHPTAQVQPLILDNVWTGLAPLLKRERLQ